MRTSSLTILSIAWPSSKSGIGLAVRSSLDCCAKHWNSIYFIAITDEEMIEDLRSAYPNINFVHIPIRHQPHSIRYAKSIFSKHPATINFVINADTRTRLTQAIRLRQTSNTDEYFLIETLAPTYFIELIRSIRPNGKIIYNSHDINHIAFSRFKNSGNYISRLLWILECRKLKDCDYRAIRNCNAFWTISHEDEAKYSEIAPKKPDGVLGVSISSSPFSKVSSGPLNNIICLGSADRRKAHGIRNFINRPWKRVLELHPKAELHLGGKHTEIFHDPSSNVFGHGFIKNETEFLSRGMIFLNPQLAGTGIKLKSLNAMAAGKVLLTTVNGALGTQGTDMEHLLICESDDDFVNKIDFAFRNPVMLEQISSNAKKLIEVEFSQIKLSERLHILLRKI